MPPGRSHTQKILNSTREMVRRIINHEVKNLVLSIQLELEDLRISINSVRHSRINRLIKKAQDEADDLINAIQEFNDRIQDDFSHDEKIDMDVEINRDNIPQRSSDLERTAQKLSEQISDEARKYQTPGRDIRRTALKIERVINVLTEIFSGGRAAGQKKMMQLAVVVRDLIGSIPRKDRERVHVKDFSVRAVQANADQIFIVLSNLVQNALTYYNPGQKSEVWIDASIESISKYSTEFPFVGHFVDEEHGSGDWLCIFVSDSGRGVPESKHGAIFAPLTRLDASGRKIKDSGSEDEADLPSPERGKGIGLTLVKLVAEQHSGLITLRKRTPIGTEFLFAFPV